MSEPTPKPKIQHVAHVTTTRRIVGEFEGPACATDLTLRELRAVVEAAADMPDEALVSVRVDGDWRTPTRLLIERNDQRPAEESDLVRSDEMARADEPA